MVVLNDAEKACLLLLGSSENRIVTSMETVDELCKKGLVYWSSHNHCDLTDEGYKAYKAIGGTGY